MPVAGSNYYVRILSTIDRELLKPSASVALHKHSNALVDVLPPEADSSISMLRAGKCHHGAGNSSPTGALIVLCHPRIGRRQSQSTDKLCRRRCRVTTLAVSRRSSGKKSERTLGSQWLWLPDLCLFQFPSTVSVCGATYRAMGVCHIHLHCRQYCSRQQTA